jgi:hypothetical protein
MLKNVDSYDVVRALDSKYDDMQETKGRSR